MQLSSFRVACLSYKFSWEFSILGKMRRGIKTIPVCDSHPLPSQNVGADGHADAKGESYNLRRETSLKKAVISSKRQQISPGNSDSVDEEWPSLSASMSSKYQNKRRTRVDLGAHSKSKSDQMSEVSYSLHDGSSTASCFGIQQDDSSPPISSGKKNGFVSSKSPKHSQSPLALGLAVKKLNYRDYRTTDKPFDICLSPIVKHGIHEASLCEKNRQNLIEIDRKIEETGQILGPGMILLRSCLTLGEQVDIIRRCRELGVGPGGFYRPGYHDGAKLRLYMMCLGLDWDPQTRKYRKQRQHDDAEPPLIPEEFNLLVARALRNAHYLIEDRSKASRGEDVLPGMSPDVCIVNFYNTNGRLGLHQDRDESRKSLGKGLPVVSFSIGDSAEFLYGDQRDVNKAQKLILESGDVLIFGGESRHIFHGVASLIPNTAPPALLERARLRPGRLNLTFRQY